MGKEKLYACVSVCHMAQYIFAAVHKDLNQICIHIYFQFTALTDIRRFRTFMYFNAIRHKAGSVANDSAVLHTERFAYSVTVSEAKIVYCPSVLT